MKRRFKQIWAYCTKGVWNDTRSSIWVKAIKVLNLTVSSFLNKNVQRQAAALTCNTILALVPVLAILFAIGRGLGFESLLQTELFRYLPAQREALVTVIVWVDSYLAQSSQGIFIGVGVAVLAWTIFALFDNVESALNDIWEIRAERSYYRKFTDYSAIIIVLPLLIILDGGIAVLMTSASDSIKLLMPVWNVVLSIAPYVLMSLFFIGVFKLFPATKVKLRHTLIPGIACGIGFQLLQWLFVTGQIYVSRYNAIYGSFAFLPLLIVWMQLVWVMTLTGATLTFASQNFFRHDFKQEVDGISQSYLSSVAVSVMATIARRFEAGADPIAMEELARELHLPYALTDKVCGLLSAAALINKSRTAADIDGYVPARPPESITVGSVAEALRTLGASDFLPEFTPSPRLTHPDCPIAQA